MKNLKNFFNSLIKSCHNKGFRLSMTESFLGEGVRKKLAFTLAEGATHIRNFADTLKNSSSHGSGATHVNNFANSRKFAFTLAEVLITIGIIGVVAALTLPNLMYQIQIKTLQTQLKKTYAEWNQISRKFMIDHDEAVPSYHRRNGTVALYDELKNYIKGSSDLSNGTYNYNAAMQNKPPYKIYNINGLSTYFGICDQAGGLHMGVNGSVYAVDDAPSSGYNGPPLCVDINGPKKPNLIGADLFIFVFTEDGLVLPLEDPKAIPAMWNHKRTTSNATDPITTCLNPQDIVDNTAFRRGYFCAYNALRDINPNGTGSYWKDFIGKKQYLE